MSGIFYRKVGKGQPIILIHGFCETHEIWNGLEEGLSKKFTVFSIDLPGFGTSSILETPFSIDDVGAKVCDWVIQQEIDQPVVIGHSLGGYVALAMAKQSPEKIMGIGLLQSTAFPDSEEKKANRNKVIDFVKAYGTDPFIDTFVPGLFYNNKNEAIREVDSIARKTSLPTLLAYTTAMRDRSSSIGFIKDNKKPILILGGEKDAIIPAEITLEHGRLASNSIVYLLKDIGHMAMYESPVETQNAIELLINRLTAYALD
jgi:pimeloyl-ACP methyl ester carboxylesterase